MHNKLASSIFGAEQNIHYIIGQELQNLTNILISKDFSHQVHIPNFGGLSGSEDRGGGDNSIQLMNFWRVGDKSFK